MNIRHRLQAIYISARGSLFHICSCISSVLIFYSCLLLFSQTESLAFFFWWFVCIPDNRKVRETQKKNRNQTDTQQQMILASKNQHAWTSFGHKKREFHPFSTDWWLLTTFRLINAFYWSWLKWKIRVGGWFTSYVTRGSSLELV